MTTLAPVLQAFFTERLMAQRRASSHTITGYRDTLRLLVGFACAKTGRVQVVCAKSSASFSDGFIYPRVLRGLLLRLRAIRAMSSAE